MRPILALAIVLTLLGSITALAAKDDADLGGTYVANGVGVGGAAYTADVTVTQRGDTYLIKWKFGDGEFNGVGIRQGDVLSVGWSNHDKAGVVLYTIKGATLEGRWADGSTNGKIYTETLKRRE